MSDDRLGRPMRRGPGRRRLLRATVLGGAGMASAWLVACGGDNEGTGAAKPQGESAVVPAKPLGVIKMAIANDTQSGDPALTGGGSWPVTAYAFNGMIALNLTTRQYVGNLATGWRAADGQGKVWEYELRPGVHFHDGTDVTADDVVFSYTRQFDPAVKATRGAEFKRVLANVEAVERTKMRFTLNVADVTWPSTSGNESIVPKAYTERVGLNEFAAKPVGTGPFKLKQRDVNSRIIYEANTDFWNTDDKSGIVYRPQVSGAELRILPEAETRISALLAGEVDIACNVPASAVKRLQAERGVSIQHADSGQPTSLLINSQREQAAGGGPNPYRDKRVRQALNYAVDVDQIIKTVLTGNEVKETGVTPLALGLATDVKPYPYDPAKAKQLLDAAGYGNGIGKDDAVIFNPGDRWAQSRDMCEAVAGYLRKVGIEATVQDLEYATHAAELVAKRLYPFAFWGQHSTPEIINQIDYFMVNPGVRGLYGGNPKIDSLAAQARTTVDEAARAKLYGEIHRTFHEDAGHIFLVTALYTYATKGDWRWTPSNGPEVPLWTVTRA
jgi:peptide/nickel transport system substrate-binding protein